MDNAYTVVVPGDAVAVVVVVDEVVVGGAVDDDAEPVAGDAEAVVVTRRSGVQVELSDYIREQAGDSGSLPGSGQAVRLLPPDSGDFAQQTIVGAEGRARCIRFAEDKGAEKASEEEGMYSGVHMNYMPGH